MMKHPKEDDYPKYYAAFVKSIDRKLFDWDKPLIPAAAIGVVVAAVVLTMCIVNATECRAVSAFGHGHYHKYKVERSPPKCALLLFEMTGQWDDGGQPCFVEGTEGVFDVPFCDDEEYDRIEHQGLTNAHTIMDGASECTDMDYIYLAYYLECADTGTAIGAGFGYAGIAQVLATLIFLKLFEVTGVIKRHGDLASVQPDPTEGSTAIVPK